MVSSNFTFFWRNLNSCSNFDHIDNNGGDDDDDDNDDKDDEDANADVPPQAPPPPQCPRQELEAAQVV